MPDQGRALLRKSAELSLAVGSHEEDLSKVGGASILSIFTFYKDHSSEGAGGS